MVGFLKKLFGGGSSANVDTASLKPNEVYKGVEIRANPMKADGGQWRIAGTLTKHINGETAVRQFVRADLVQNRDEAITSSVSKAKLIIDQNGESVWSGDPNRPV